MKKILACFILGLALTACDNSGPLGDGNNVDSAASSDDVAALAGFGDAWRAAYEVGDFAALENLYEPDAWLMPSEKAAQKGRDDIIDYFRKSRVPGAKASIVFENESRIIDGDFAFETAHWWLEFPREGQAPILSSGRSLLVFKRGSDGGWRIWRDIDNHTPDVTFESKPDVN